MRDVVSGEVGGRPSTPQPDPTLTVQTGRARARRLLWVGATFTLLYAVIVLFMAARAGSLGFVSVLGGPVKSVDAGGPAADAGLRAGDAIVSVNGVDTPRGWDREHAIRWLKAGEQLTLGVSRGAEIVQVSYTLPRKWPFAAGAGAALAAAMMLLAMIAYRDDAGPPRSFFRSTVVYGFFLSGTFAWETVIRLPLLGVPWMFAMALAAPVTCHFVLQFPAGPATLSRRTLVWLYVPPLLVAAWQIGIVLAFRLRLVDNVEGLLMRGTQLTLVGATAYLTIGAVARARRLRRKRAEIDPVAAKWLHAGGLVMAGSMLAGVVAAAIDMDAFVGGGFRPYIAVAMVGGSVCLVLSMTRTRFGDLDKVLRRGTGHAVANAVAAALYLAVIVALSGAEIVTSGRSAGIAVGSTLLALLTFGPLRSWVHSIAEERLANDRQRARRMLKRASEAALGTLDVDTLQGGLVKQVAEALRADGAALFVAQESPEPDDPRWTLVATAGQVTLAATLGKKHAVALELDRRAMRGTAGGISGGALAAPIPVDGTPLIMVVFPSVARPIDDEDRELVETLCAGLAVAVANARTHTELLAMAVRLKEEVEQSEKRRKEIARLKDRIEEEKRFLEAELTRRGGRPPIIGAGLRPTYELVQKVARADAAVLVRGETGVGKELVARAIHAGGARRGAPFIVVDCGAVAAGLFESTLFGHEKGSFTGATRTQLGAFRAAHGGTLFLDEIGELPLDLQPKLLRVLQEKEVLAVGAERPIGVDVRIVAGTNRDLASEVDHGRFREDLLYRLRVVEVVVPPLRTRKKDIPELAEAFLAEVAGRRSLPAKRLSPDAVAALMDHDWPGNVRELEHAVEAAALYASGDEIHAGDLPIAGDVFRRKAQDKVSQVGDGGPGLRETLDGLEKDRLMQALRDHGGNRTAAARSLGISRGALLRRIERYGVDL